MAVKVVGKFIGEFKDKDDSSKVIKYGKVYVEFSDTSKTGLVGLCCEAISMKPELVESIPVGKEISIVYNRYGKAEDFVLKTA